MWRQGRYVALLKHWSKTIEHFFVRTLLERLAIWISEQSDRIADLAFEVRTQTNRREFVLRRRLRSIRDHPQIDSGIEHGPRLRESSQFLNRALRMPTYEGNVLP